MATCLFGLPLALSTSLSAQGNNDIKVNGYSDIIIFDQPVAYYRFEETTGSKTQNLGTAGAEADGLWMIGNGPDDSSPGTASVDAGPRPPDFKGFEAANNAGKFLGPDGSIWVDAQKQLLNSLGAFSLEYWVKPANRVADPAAFGTRIGIVGQNDAIEYGFIDQNTIQIWTPNGGALNTTYTFPDNEWHHVATIATGSDIRNYFDGKLVGTGGSSASGNYGTSTYNVHVGGGGAFDAAGNFFTGGIDEVAIFDKAIPADRIAQHYKAAKEGAFTVPFINEPLGNSAGFTIEVNDFGSIVADTNTIVLSLNGATITPTSVTKSGKVTKVTYTPPNPFPSQSTQNTSMTIKDTSGVTYSDTGSFTVEYYATLPASLKVTNVDTSKPGFVWNVFQNEADQSNSNARAEREVAGDMTNPDGTPMDNLADPNATGVALAVGSPATPGSKPIRFEIDTVVNMSQVGGEANGNFPDDGQMPGIPGLTGSTDGIGAEIITWVELPKGWVTMGVNSDDGFGTTAGVSGDVFQQIVLGVFDAGRGAADTIFKFLVEEAGIYRLRTIYEEGGGGANIEWFTVKADGTKVLLNDTANGGFKAYRAVTGTAKVPAKVTRVVPAIGATDAGPNLVAADIRDGDTPIDKATVSLKVDGAAVAAQVNKVGAITTATYTPSPLFAVGSKHKATLQYTEAGTVISREWEFTVAPFTADKVKQYVGVLKQSSQFTADKGGASGAAGDYGMDNTAAGGAIQVTDASFLTALNAATAKDELSVGLWIKKYDIANSSAFWFRSPSQARVFQAHTPWSDGSIYFDTAGCCDGSTQRINANISQFADYTGDATWWNSWHYYLFTKKADAKQIWIDGKLFHEGSNTGTLSTDVSELIIGAETVTGSRMHAVMDDFAVFSTALVEADAKALAGGTLPTALPASKGLLAYWDFNDPPAPPALANIAWVSFHPADNTPSADAATAGFTKAPDVGYTDLLKANGYQVTRIVTSGTPDTALLNTFDLVMISRSVPSADYQDAPETLAWNNKVTAPTMILGGYVLRNSRLGYTTGATIPDTTNAAVKLSVKNPTHPIFAGVQLDANNTMLNTYATLVSYTNLVQQGISVNTDPVAGGGTILATIGTAGDPAFGGMVIGEWQAGAKLANGAADTLGGHRLVFLTGSRERTITSQGSGIYDLAADGAKLFLNAVNYMTQPVQPPGPSLTVVKTEAGISITYTGTLQSADTVLGPWTDVPGATSPATIPTTGVQRYFRSRQ